MPTAAGPRPTREPPGLWNVANVLTMVRLLLVPALVVLMFAGGGHDPGWRSLAWAAFSVAMITDLLDGELARRRNLVTDFGKIVDPIADKAVMGAALICLSVLSDLPWWVTVTILTREIGITLLRLWVIRHGVIPASRGGKLKTLAQGVGVGMYILSLTGVLATLRWWVMALAVVLTVGTGLDYVRRAVLLRRASLAAGRAGESSAGGSSTGDESGDPDRTAAAAGGKDDTAALAAEVLDLLRRRRQTLAVAESLTGGLVAAALTAVPGASRVFRGSVTAYATDLKRDVLGVDGQLLAERGAVDSEVARHLAEGVRSRLAADWGVATTGVAGPDPQDGQPAGTVHVAVSAPGTGGVVAQRLDLAGDRAAVRAGSVHAVLTLLRNELIHTAAGAGQDTEQNGDDGCLQP